MKGDCDIFKLNLHKTTITMLRNCFSGIKLDIKQNQYLNQGASELKESIRNAPWHYHRIDYKH